MEYIRQRFLLHSPLHLPWEMTLPEKEQQTQPKRRFFYGKRCFGCVFRGMNNNIAVKGTTFVKFTKVVPLNCFTAIVSEWNRKIPESIWTDFRKIPKSFEAFICKIPKSCKLNRNHGAALLEMIEEEKGDAAIGSEGV